MEKKVLLLNSTYEPMKILTWQQAIMLYFGDKVKVVAEYDDFPLGTQNFTMPCPAVIVLKKYIHLDKKKVTFSRTNVFSRDHYTCQYCGDTPGSSRLTYDHVLPRSRGGKTVWDNIVACCYECNFKKADRTPQEAKMPLLKEPYAPSSFAQLTRNFRSANMPEQWDPFLQK